jgi:hypothetical protein
MDDHFYRIKDFADLDYVWKTYKPCDISWNGRDGVYLGCVFYTPKHIVDDAIEEIEGYPVSTTNLCSHLMTFSIRHEGETIAATSKRLREMVERITDHAKTGCEMGKKNLALLKEWLPRLDDSCGSEK